VHSTGYKLVQIICKSSPSYYMSPIARVVIEPRWVLIFKLGLVNCFRTRAEIELITELDNLFKLCSFVFQMSSNLFTR
jgi:hypothetical protein